MSQLILFNKPFQVLSQFQDEANRQTLKNFINIKHVYPAGRLDYDSEGLLLLTDDGKLQHKISHPNNKMEKTYLAQIERIPSEADLDQLRQGIQTNKAYYKPCKVKLIEEPSLWPRTPPIRYRANIPTSWLELKIKEGQNRQVRKMTAAIGYPTLRLIRTQIGQWQLGTLQPSEFKVLSYI